MTFENWMKIEKLRAKIGVFWDLQSRFYQENSELVLCTLIFVNHLHVKILTVV